MGRMPEWGWRYHHVGIPTAGKKAGEVYIPHLKSYVSGFPESPFGVEWMHFEEDCPLHPLVRTVPHVARWPMWRLKSGSGTSRC